MNVELVEAPVDQATERILDAATAEFARRGVRRTTMNQIANAAGLGVATVYRRFPQKDQLVRSLIPLYLARAVEANDLRRSLEGTEEERDPPVVAQVRDGLDAAAGEVEVGDRGRIENAERVESLGRDVDVPVAASGSGADEEDMLGTQERRHALVDAVVGLSHIGIFAAAARDHKEHK